MGLQIVALGLASSYIDKVGYGPIKGNFDAGKAKGTLRYHFDQLGCDTGRVTWRARKTG
jgi:hypothetical protein